MKGAIGNFFLYIIGLILFLGSFFYGILLLFDGSYLAAFGMGLPLFIGLMFIMISYRIYLRKTEENMTFWGFLSYVFMGFLYIMQ